MATSIFGIGVSGLNAAQANLLVTSHNITNAGTEGFHRQHAIQGTQTPQETGAGFFGKGTTVESVRRSYSQFLNSALLQAQTQAGYLEAYDAQISQLDNLLADPTSGLSPALQSFFSAVQDVASNPASQPSRQLLLSEAHSLVARFQTFDARLTEMRTGVNNQLNDTVTNVNALAQQISRINDQLIRSQLSESKPANDLLDQRDNLINQLNQLVRTNVVTQSDGSINVFIGNGQSLVLGTQAFSLATAPSSADPQNNAIHYVAGGNNILLNPSTLQGGSLGGLLAFRSDALDGAQDELGRVAIVLAKTFNDQHRLGQDLLGALGSNFFDVPSASAIVNNDNLGTAVVGVVNSNVGVLTGSDYRLSFNAGNWTLSRLSDNTQTTFATFPQTIDGVTLNLNSGVAQNGDSFLIRPTRLGARDIDVVVTDTARIAAAAPVRTASATTNTGKATVNPGMVVDTTNAAFATPGALTPPIMIQFTSSTQYSIYDNTNPAIPILLEGGLGYDPALNNNVFPTSGALDYGYRISLTGVAAVGDKFTVDFNSGGVADNRNALLLSGLQTSNTVASGTANYQSAYSQMVSRIGNRSREVEVQGKAQESLVRQTREAQQALSGVNLDEEAANLIRFQQAYQASGRVLQLASTLFDTILEIGR